MIIEATLVGESQILGNENLRDLVSKVPMRYQILNLELKHRAITDGYNLNSLYK